MALPKLNEKLIAQVMAHIKKFPHAYVQSDIAAPVDVTKETPCGAIGCFGGWAVLLSYPKEARREEASHVKLSYAMELLGLTEYEADFLFDAGYGNPKKDYKLIEKRLNHIRKSRAKVNLIEKKEAEIAKIRDKAVHPSFLELTYD